MMAHRRLDNRRRTLSHRTTTTATTAMTSSSLLVIGAATLAMMMLASSAQVATAYSDSAADLSGAQKKAEGKIQIVRVGEGSVEVSATTRRTGVVKLVGHPYFAVHKMFHHLTLEVFDDGGLVANDCQLQRFTERSVIKKKKAQQPVGKTAGGGEENDAAAATPPTTATPTTTTTTTRDTSKVRQRKGPGHGKLTGAAPAVLATFGPFDSSATLTFKCERYKLPAAEPVRYRARLVSSPGPDKSRVARLVIGAALIALAPVVSSWTMAYYGAGMALSVLAVALLILYRVSRAMPGNRTVKAGAGAALFAALALDPSHLSRVLQAYVSICLKPVQLVVRAVIEQNPDEAGLPYALFATFVMLVGAGLGFWVVRRWMIEPTSGRIAPSVSGFCCVAMRIVGVVLLHFSTLDMLCGAALAGCGLGVTIFEPMVSNLKRRDDQRTPSSAAARTPVSAGGTGGARSAGRGGGDGRTGGSRGGGVGGGGGRGAAADECVRRRVSFGATADTPSGGGGGGGSAGRRQRSGGNGNDDAAGDEENDNGGGVGSPFGLLGSPFSLFNMSGGERRGRGRGGRGGEADRFPESLDPEPRTPPVVLIGTGAGAVGRSPGRTPGLGLRPWRLIGLGNIFGGGGGGGAADDENDDDTSDGWEAERAAAAAKTGGKAGAGGRGAATGARGGAGAAARSSPGGGRGGRRGAATPFAPSPLGVPFSATPRGGGGAAGAGSPAPPAPPVGMAAAAKGRFITKAEYDAMGAEATDAGLDSLYGTPEFTKWMRSQSHRIRLTREDYDDEEED